MPTDLELFCTRCEDYTDHIEDGDSRICQTCGDTTQFIDWDGDRYVWTTETLGPVRS